MTRTKRIVTTSGLAVAALVTSSAPAGAEVLEHGRESFINIEVIDDYCDLPGFPDLTVHREQRFEFTFLARSQGPDGLVYFADHIRFTTVRTNVANGKTVTTKGRFLTKDVKVTDNGDGTLTVRVATTGSDQTVNSAGKLVQNESGRTVFEVLIDHHGTPADPSDDEEIEFLGVTQDNFHIKPDRDFCEIVHENLA